MNFISDDELKRTIQHELGHYILFFTKFDLHDFTININLTKIGCISGFFKHEPSMMNSDDFIYICAAGYIAEVLENDEIDLKKAYELLTEHENIDFGDVITYDYSQIKEELNKIIKFNLDNVNQIKKEFYPDKSEEEVYELIKKTNLEYAEQIEKDLLPDGKILNEIKRIILFYKDAIKSITDYVIEKYKNDPCLEIILSREELKRIKGAELLSENL